MKNWQNITFFIPKMCNFAQNGYVYGNQKDYIEGLGGMERKQTP